MPIAEELVTVLGYDIKGQGKLKEYQRGLDVTERKAKGAAAGIVAAGKSLGGFLAAAGAARAVSSAVTNFADLERRMNRIGITAGVSRAQTLVAVAEVQNLAKQYALSTDQAVTGLETLTSMGMNFKDAMAFLPSILLTAQASGAATEDMARTAIKSAAALKIQASQMQYAFDIMVAGGKAGEFELRNMAEFIPDLANSFASLGYSGTDGLKMLVAMLQTLQEDTGSAGAAATQAQNIFGKMMSSETINTFKKKFGIDLPKEMKKAKKAGVDTLSAFIALSEKALKGDLSKLPLLFTDQEFRLGMQSLLTSKDRLKAFLDMVNSGDVKGGALKDFNQISDDTQASIDRMWASWDRFSTSVMKFSAPGVTSFFDTLNDGMEKFQRGGDRRDAELKGLADSGYGWLEARAWLLDPRNGKEQHDAMARKGGWAPTTEARAARAAAPYAYEKLGRLPNRPISRPEQRPEHLNPERGGRRRTISNTPDINSRIPNAYGDGAYDDGWLLQLDRNRQLLQGQAKAVPPVRVPAVLAFGMLPQSGRAAPVPRVSGDAPRTRSWVPAPPANAGYGDEPLLPANAMPLSGPGGDLMAKFQRAMDFAGGNGGGGGGSISADMSTTNNITTNVEAPVTVHVQQASQAPAAVGSAIAGAIQRGPQSAPAEPARFHTATTQK